MKLKATLPLYLPNSVLLLSVEIAVRNIVITLRTLYPKRGRERCYSPRIATECRPGERGTPLGTSTGL